MGEEGEKQQNFDVIFSGVFCFLSELLEYIGWGCYLYIAAEPMWAVLMMTTSLWKWLKPGIVAALGSSPPCSKDRLWGKTVVG